MRPHVSLIIPVHNAEPFLERCLASAAAQTEPQLEIICIDDASTDGSGAMLDAKAQADTRFKIVHRPANGGEWAARAQGESLAVRDHAQMLEPVACRLLYEAARATDADIVRGRVRTIDYNGQAHLSPLQLHKDICNISRFYFCVNWYTAIYRTSLVQGRLHFAEEYVLGGDILFLTEVLLSTSKVQCIDDLVYTHVLRPNSGASLILSPQKVQSTISSRLHLISLLHKANLNILDIEGYLHKMEQCFGNIIVVMHSQCIDARSRIQCCDALFSILKLHRNPELFSDFLKRATSFLWPYFKNNKQSLLIGMIKKQGDVPSSIFVSKLRADVLRESSQIIAQDLRRIYTANKTF